MIERRKILKSIPAGAAGLSALGLTVASLKQGSAGNEQAAVSALEIDPAARDAFPDVEVMAHTGERFQFYEDLIRDKIVLVNFMSIRGEELFPVTANLAKVAARLGDKLGRDVFINSITRDIGYDSLERLAAFAESYDTPVGWRFLTGTQPVTTALATRLYRCPPGSDIICRPRSNGAYVDVVFYGNGGLGLWSAFPGLIDPDDAASRIAWVMPGQKSTGPMRRAGPRRFAVKDRVSHNREV